VRPDWKARAVALAGSAVFLVIAPGTVAGYVPWAFTRWSVGPALLGIAALRVAGALLLALGAVGLLDCFRRFAVEGLGTPAPVRPPRTLIITGLYRFVRNPMYCAIVAAVAGQALILGSTALLWYGAALWLMFHVWVLIYEEPRLTDSFGPAYRAFCGAVPRWVPRLTRWRGPP
jgi:protein-S-isoprenylcysteine O-methyltransferase Ste14